MHRITAVVIKILTYDSQIRAKLFAVYLALLLINLLYLLLNTWNSLRVTTVPVAAGNWPSFRMIEWLFENQAPLTFVFVETS